MSGGHNYFYFLIMGKDTQRVLYAKTKVFDRVTFCALQGKNPLTLFSPFSIAVDCLYLAICPHKKADSTHEAD